MNLLTCALAATLAAATLTTQIAAACGGGYGDVQRAPQVVLVSTHRAYTGAGPTVRSFALLGESSIDIAHEKWSLVAPRSYDSTLVFDENRSTPTTLTLVGFGGSRVVTAKRRVALKHALWIHDATFDAVEVPTSGTEDAVIALRGNVQSATLVAPTYRYGDDMRFGNGLTAQYTTSRDSQAFELSRDGTLLGTFDGRPLGVLTVNDRRYLVIRNRGVASTFAL